MFASLESKIREHRLIKSLTKHFDVWMIYIALAYILLLFLIPRNGHPGDITFWTYWGNEFLKNGFGQAYNISGINHMPINLYVIYIWANIADFLGLNLANAFHTFKSITLVFDMLSVYFITRLLANWGKPRELALIVLFSIPFLYNTMMWGQFDSIYTLWVALTLYAAVTKKPVVASIVYTLAILSKLQAVAFLPLVAILLVPQIWQRPFLVIKMAGGALITAGIILLPFALGGSLSGFITAATSSVDYYTEVSLGAYNIWYLLLGQQSQVIKDTLVVAPFTIKMWGLLVFSLVTLATLQPVVTRLWTKKFNWGGRGEVQLVFATATLMALNFFFFNSQMHDRYSHPMMLLAVIYCLSRGRYGLYLATSVLYFLNIESVLRYLQLPEVVYTNFDPRIIAAGFGVLIVYLLLTLDSKFKSKHKLHE